MHGCTFALALQIKFPQNVSDGSNAVGLTTRPDSGSGKPSAGPPHGAPQTARIPSSFSSPCLEFKSAVPRITLGIERTDIRDEAGNLVMRVTDAKLVALRDAGLIEFHGRRRITHATLRLGVAPSSLNAKLRAGIRAKLPVAEDNRTVQRRFVAGGGVYFDVIHEQAWDDCRPLDNRCLDPGNQEYYGKPCTLGNGGFVGANERGGRDDE